MSDGTLHPTDPGRPRDAAPPGRGRWSAVLLGRRDRRPAPRRRSTTRRRPRCGGFPFFYWFQFALIPVVSLFTFIAFRLSLTRHRARTARPSACRRARRGRR